MTSKVRIAYTVPLTDVPKEVQILISRIQDTVLSISSTLEDINFVDDFAVSHGKLKNILLLQDKLQMTLEDSMVLSDGYLELQASIATTRNVDDINTTQELSPQSQEATDDTV